MIVRSITLAIFQEIGMAHRILLIIVVIGIRVEGPLVDN
jgi:hypothetical protein